MLSTVIVTVACVLVWNVQIATVWRVRGAGARFKKDSIRMYRPYPSLPRGMLGGGWGTLPEKTVAKNSPQEAK